MNRQTRAFAIIVGVAGTIWAMGSPALSQSEQAQAVASATASPSPQALASQFMGKLEWIEEDLSKGESAERGGKGKAAVKGTGGIATAQSRVEKQLELLGAPMSAQSATDSGSLQFPSIRKASSGSMHSKKR